MAPWLCTASWWLPLAAGTNRTECGRSHPSPSMELKHSTKGLIQAPHSPKESSGLHTDHPAVFSPLIVSHHNANQIQLLHHNLQSLFHSCLYLHFSPAKPSSITVSHSSGLCQLLGDAKVFPGLWSFYLGLPLPGFYKVVGPSAKLQVRCFKLRKASLLPLFIMLYHSAQCFPAFITTMEAGRGGSRL